MIANYHTHTWRCMHAGGEEKQYVEQAIQRGMRILGFSDHTPYPFPEGYVSGMRMKMQQLEGYVKKVLDLKEEYKKDIEIYLGLEVEYYPMFWDQLIDYLDSYPIEYMILGQHHLDNEIQYAHASGKCTKSRAILKKYVDQCIEAMDTGKFLYLAHPDVLNFRGVPEIFDEQFRRLCKEALKHDMPLEINFLGIDEQRWYPQNRFWEIAAQEQNSVIFGCDAHQPQKVSNPSAEKKAAKIVEQYGLKRLETLHIERLAENF